MSIHNNKLELMLKDAPQTVLVGRKAGTFDSYSVAFPSLFRENKEIFLYYTGSPDRNWSFASIGVAWSKDGLNFTRKRDSILMDQFLSDFACEAVTPAVARVRSDYFMVLSGRKHRYNRRVLGIAHSDEPKGPFTLIKKIHKPIEPWEGFSIDNGTTLIKEEEDTLILYYSNCAPSLTDFILRKPFRRSIGILKIKIRGADQDSIETLYPRTNPIISLSGDIGEWNESVFCPGYLLNNDNRNLFFAASRYTAKHSLQSIGYVTVDSPYIRRVIGKPKKLIDHTNFKLKKGTPLAFDSPSPLTIGDGKIFLFYSVMDRRIGSWKIMRNTIELKV